MGYIPLYLYFIGLCFITSLTVYFSGNNKSYWYLKFFPPFLLATFIAEWYGAYLSDTNQSNIMVYNSFSIVEFCFYLVVLSFIVSSPLAKTVIRITAIIYPFTAVANILFFQGKESFHTITYSIGCLIIVLVCVYYFLELFRFPKFVKLTRIPAFWICSGLLFFYCCGFPLFAFVNFWGRVSWVINNLDSIITIINIFLYTLFIIAFLCNKPRKYTLSSS